MKFPQCSVIFWWLQARIVHETYGMIWSVFTSLGRIGVIIDATLQIVKSDPLFHNSIHLRITTLHIPLSDQHTPHLNSETP